jgi:excinuclease ABC subunit C
MSIPEHLKKYINRLPQEPGVYFFKRDDEILYIGKATSLKDRVKSYFSKDLFQQRNARVVRAVAISNVIDFIQTPSVIEALILEANLIKKYQPQANTKDKDDKSYSYVIVTREKFPRVYTVRGKELQTTLDPDDLKYVFGPFTNARALRTALQIIRNIFPFRGEKDPVKLNPRKHSTLNIQLGISPNFNTMPQGEYSKNIRNIKYFFEGKKEKLITVLTKEMNEHAKKLHFEKAEMIRRSLWSIQHIQDTALISRDFEKHDTHISYRIEAYDIAHIMGSNMVGVMVVINQKNPQKADYRKFTITSVQSKSDDTKALEEVMRRRFTHEEWSLPRLIVIDGGKGQYNRARKVLTDFGYEIPVVSVIKDEKHKPKAFIGDKAIISEHEDEILLANSEAHRFALAFHQQKRKIK